MCVLETPKIIIQQTQQCCPFYNRFLVIVTSVLIFTFHMYVVVFLVKLLWFVYIFRLNTCRLTFWCYLPYTIHIVHNNYEPTSQNTDKHQTSCTQKGLIRRLKSLCITCIYTQIVYMICDITLILIGPLYLYPWISGI